MSAQFLQRQRRVFTGNEHRMILGKRPVDHSGNCGIVAAPGPAGRMHNHEASGSESDDDDDVKDKALVAAVLEAEMEDFGELPAVDPEVQRRQEIMAEVARRRKEMEGHMTKKKSDEIFGHFDVDRDGFLNYHELNALGEATGGNLPRAAFTSICQGY